MSVCHVTRVTYTGVSLSVVEHRAPNTRAFPPPSVFWEPASQFPASLIRVQCIIRYIRKGQRAEATAVPRIQSSNCKPKIRAYQLNITNVWISTVWSIPQQHFLPQSTYYWDQSQSAVTAQSEAWAVFVLSKSRVVGSDPNQSTDVCMRLFGTFVALCVGKDFETGWSPGQGVMSDVYTTKELGNGPRSNNGP